MGESIERTTTGNRGILSLGLDQFYGLLWAAHRADARGFIEVPQWLGVPTGARVCGFYFAIESQTIEIVIEHPDIPATESGRALPRLTVPLRMRVLQLARPTGGSAAPPVAANARTLAAGLTPLDQSECGIENRRKS